jgi:glyoxylase-like metal-dependent hydrolase (beta-lactamase superfamily II)
MVHASDHTRGDAAIGWCREIAPGVYWLPIRGTNVYFVRSGSAWVLIDAAWSGSSSAIHCAAASLFGEHDRPAAILLTHVHPDHSGAAHALAQAWDCPVYVYPDELPLATTSDRATIMRYGSPLDHWMVFPLLHLFPRQWDAMIAQGSLKEVVRALDPSAVPGLPDWRCIPTPGHSAGHVAYFRERDRVLITGDALLTVNLNAPVVWLLWALRPGRSVIGVRSHTPRVAGSPRWMNGDQRAAQASVAALVRLEPRVVAPGHGVPLAGERAAAALHAYTARFAGAEISRLDPSRGGTWFGG